MSNPDRGLHAKAVAEFERREKLLIEDNPENDATDAAHPAWWRGHHDCETKLKAKLIERSGELIRYMAGRAAIAPSSELTAYVREWIESAGRPDPARNEAPGETTKNP